MRKIVEVLRMNSKGHSNRQIANSCMISKTTVADYLERCKLVGLTWPLPVDLTESELEARLFPKGPGPVQNPDCPDWQEIRSELSKKGVTLTLLWQEYSENQPNGYHYSWFCKKYREWAKGSNLVMRQNHKAGEKLFVDYVGDTPSPPTGIDPPSTDQN